jgi:cysteine synthase A
LKEKFPDIKVIGVDVEGSMVFNDKVRKRKLSGIGAGKQSVLIHNAIIDDMIILSEREIVLGCLELMQQHNLLAGASAGAAFLAAKRTLLKHNRVHANAVFITPDNGISYLDTVFNNEWVENNIE